MKTWWRNNPDWKYIRWNNDRVYGRTWRNQHLIDHYTAIAENTKTFTSARGAVFTGEKATLFAWHVIADILRYEILHEFGGYMPGADTICVRPLTEAAPWLEHDLYTVNTGHLFAEKLQSLSLDAPNYELLRKRYAPLNASPILASSQGNPWLDMVITELGKKTELAEAVDTTGNVFMGEMLALRSPENALILPYYKRDHPSRLNSYSRHFSGTTRGSYRRGRISTSKRRR